MDADVTVLGLDIGGTQARAALVRGGRIIAGRAISWPHAQPAHADVECIVDLARDLIGKAASPQAIGAVGVALAALVDRDGTVVQWPNRPSWRGLPFRALLESRLALPTVVEDDANAAALAEWRFGAGQAYQQVLVMTVGTGVGAGLILDGRLLRGQHGWAGELGHLVVLPDGPPCACGLYGCLQTVASGRALERAAAEHGLPGASSVTAAAERGEAWACAALAACGRWLGLAAANVVNLLDLQAVIVGGTLSTIGGPLWPTLEATLQANIRNRLYREVDLRRALLPDTAGLLGAASLAAQRLGIESSLVEECRG